MELLWFPVIVAVQFLFTTGLALLPFLGAGQTHMSGEYRDVVIMEKFLGKPSK